MHALSLGIYCEIHQYETINPQRIMHIEYTLCIQSTLYDYSILSHLQRLLGADSWRIVGNKIHVISFNSSADSFFPPFVPLTYTSHIRIYFTGTGHGNDLCPRHIKKYQCLIQVE